MTEDISKTWAGHVLDSLSSLKTTVPPDVYLIVGANGISTHKAALQLNCPGFTAEVTNRVQGVDEIEILPEFWDHYEVLSQIVDGFYSGIVGVKEENMKLVYKFAKVYSVKWLEDSVRSVIVKYMAGDQKCQRFVEIFKFSHSIMCESLQKECLEILCDEFVEELIKAQCLEELDFFCLMTMTAHENLGFQEKLLFELVICWLNLDADKRICHGDLLLNVQYSLIDKSDLNEYVFDAILDLQKLDENVRRTLLQIFRETIKNPGETNQLCRKVTSELKIIPETDVIIPKAAPIEVLNSDNDRVLNLICNMDMKNVSHKDLFEGDEIENLIMYKFERTDVKTQCLIMRYLECRLISSMLTGLQITACFELYSRFNSLSLLINICLSFFVVGDHYSHHKEIRNIQWQKIPYETINTIVSNRVIASTFSNYDNNGERNGCIMRFEGCTQIEIIMMWALAHPKEKSHIQSLLNTICYARIPSNYMDLILLPYVKKLLPSIDSTGSLKCSKDHRHDESRKVEDLLCVVAPNSLHVSEDSKICILQRNHSRQDPESLRRIDIFVSYDARLHCSPLSLNIDFNSRPLRGILKFLIFDAHECMEEYPLFMKAHDPTFLKTVLMDWKYFDLCLMFTKLKDE